MFCCTSQQGGIPPLRRDAAHQETQIFLYITHLEEVKQLLNEAGSNFLKKGNLVNMHIAVGKLITSVPANKNIRG